MKIKKEICKLWSIEQILQNGIPVKQIIRKIFNIKQELAVFYNPPGKVPEFPLFILDINIELEYFDVTDVLLELEYLSM